MVRCAPASRPSTEAVGLTSPFSMRDREARLTPLSAGKLVERPAPRAPQRAQPFGEARISRPLDAEIVIVLSTSGNNILDNESVKTWRLRAAG